MADELATPWKRVQQGRQANKSEEQAAQALGGRRQPASGSRWYAKGDLRANGFLIDDKFTDSDSFTIKKRDFLKLMKDAAQTPPGLRPSLRISMPNLPTLRVVIEDDLQYHLAQTDKADSEHV